MFCCLFITHFLNRLCSNPTPLLFLFLDAKAQTDFIHSSLLQSVPISRTRLIFQDVNIFSTLHFEEFLPMLLKTRLTVLFLEGLCGPPILRLYCLLLALVCAPPSLKFEILSSPLPISCILLLFYYRLPQKMSNIKLIFIGPESDHYWLPLSLTH